jgi:hypothetical protein
LFGYLSHVATHVATRLTSTLNAGQSTSLDDALELGDALLKLLAASLQNPSFLGFFGQAP